MLDFPVMLWVKLPVVDRIHLQSSNKLAMGVENKATGDSKFKVVQTMIKYSLLDILGVSHRIP